MVETVREGMKQGDYYEVVLRQTFQTTYSGPRLGTVRAHAGGQPQPLRIPAAVRRRATGRRLSGDVRARRRASAWRPAPSPAPLAAPTIRCIDAENIRELLNSRKEESELTMCTDVDRNDKSRVCEPGTVKVIGRRLIETYAGLFHTVDHVEGFLKEGFDSLDAFLSHMWAVTVIGAPKKAASVAVENLEKNARGWYGGAVGDAVAQWRHQHRHPDPHHLSARRHRAPIRAGATLLYDSDPGSGRAGDAHQGDRLFPPARSAPQSTRSDRRARDDGAAGVKLLLVDNDDCFIHTLSNYARQTGAEVVTYRARFPAGAARGNRAGSDSGLAGSGPSARISAFPIWSVTRRRRHSGLRRLPGVAGHGGGVRRRTRACWITRCTASPRRIRHHKRGLFSKACRKSSRWAAIIRCYAMPRKASRVLRSDCGNRGWRDHGRSPRELPLEAVQFHPESILTARDELGLRLMRNAIRCATAARDLELA